MNDHQKDYESPVFEAHGTIAGLTQSGGGSGSPMTTGMSPTVGTTNSTTNTTFPSTT